MSRGTESPQREGPEISKRLKAERIQETLKAERIQEALVAGDNTSFREAFLVHAPSAAAKTLREFGRYMYETLLESGFRQTPAAPARAQVRAVAEDLRFSGQVLAGVAAEAEGGGLTSEETPLAMKAGSWAREVTELVRALEGAVGSARGTP